MSETFDFNSTADRGEYEHCTIMVSPSPDDPGVLVPSDETCFKTPEEARSLAENGPSNARSIFTGGLIAIHWSGPNFTGASLSISGTDCAGGGITFTGGAWDDIISSTENGCSIIEHWETSSPGSFTGDRENTVGTGGTLTYMDNRTSGVLYKGVPVLGQCGTAPVEECYAPEFRYDVLERYFPMDPTDFIEGSTLDWAADDFCGDVTISASPTVTALASLSYGAFERTTGVALRNRCQPLTDRVYLTNEYTRPFKADPTNGRRARNSVDIALDTDEGFYLNWNGTPPRGTVVDDVVRAPIFATVLNASQDLTLSSG